MPISVLGAAALGAGLNTLGGLVTSSLSHSAQRDAEDRSYYRSLELMRQQNAFNLAMWERQNRYNSPSNQLKLMKDAGLNPALFDMRGQQPAAEVTSAEAAVPYNSQAGKEYEQLGLGKIGDQTLQALQVDAQIAKLRTDITYQELVNRDLRNQIEAKEAQYDDVSYDYQPNGEEVHYDNDGNPVMDVVYRKKTNQYEEDRQRGRIGLKTDAVNNARQFEEFKGFIEDYPFLRKLTREQLKSLSEDIRAKKFNNALLQEDVKMMRQYGISSKDQSDWTALLRAALHDPDNVSRILQGIGQASVNTFTNLIGFGNTPSHNNPAPRSGSW